MNRNVQFQAMPLTPTVKKLIIVNVAIWLGLVILVQTFFMKEPYLFQWFGLIPARVIAEFWLWQPFTYMFLHAPGVFHVLFNMLILWMFGSELEQRWGSRFFLTYYLVSGIGAGVLYLIGMVILAFVMGLDAPPLYQPVVGASGAVFGLILAYGMVFGERLIYFMMIFPMKAKYFVLIIGGIELVTLLESGFSGQVANLAHLGGLVSGFLFLLFWGKWKGQTLRKRTKKHGRRLKLVVDNEPDEDKTKGPRYWN